MARCTTPRQVASFTLPGARRLLTTDLRAPLTSGHAAHIEMRPLLDGMARKMAETSARMVSLERMIRQAYVLVREEQSALAALLESQELAGSLFPESDPSFARRFVEGLKAGRSCDAPESAAASAACWAELADDAWLLGAWRHLPASRGAAAHSDGSGQELNPRDNLLARWEIVSRLERSRQQRLRQLGAQHYEAAVFSMDSGLLAECEQQLKESNACFACAELDARDTRDFGRRSERLLQRVAVCRETEKTGSLLVQGAKRSLSTFDLSQARTQLLQAHKLFSDERSIPRPLGEPYVAQVEALMDSIQSMSQRGDACLS